MLKAKMRMTILYSHQTPKKQKNTGRAQSQDDETVIVIRHLEAADTRRDTDHRSWCRLCGTLFDIFLFIFILTDLVCQIQYVPELSSGNITSCLHCSSSAAQVVQLRGFESSNYVDTAFVSFEVVWLKFYFSGMRTFISASLGFFKLDSATIIFKLTAAVFWALSRHRDTLFVLDAITIPLRYPFHYEHGLIRDVMFLPISASVLQCQLLARCHESL